MQDQRGTTTALSGMMALRFLMQFKQLGSNQMTSAIDATKPESGLAYTADMRANFLAAKQEIEKLQSRLGSIAQVRLPTLSASDFRFCPLMLSVGVISGTQTSNIMRCAPFMLSEDMLVTKLIFTQISGTATNAHIAIYSNLESAGLNLPFERLALGNDFTESTAAERISTISPVQLLKNTVYWSVFATTGSPVILCVPLATAVNYLGMKVNSSTPNGCLTTPQTAGLPADLSGYTFTKSSFPTIAMFINDN